MGAAVHAASAQHSASDRDLTMTLAAWLDDTGLITLPSGTRVRGRRLGDPASAADFGLILARGPAPAWPHGHIRWPDFWIPVNRRDALAPQDALTWVRAGYHHRAVETPWQRRWLRKVR